MEDKNQKLSSTRIQCNTEILEKLQIESIKDEVIEIGIQRI